MLYRSEFPASQHTKLSSNIIFRILLKSTAFLYAIISNALLATITHCSIKTDYKKYLLDIFIICPPV